MKRAEDESMKYGVLSEDTMISDSTIERIVDLSSDGAVVEMGRELIQRRTGAQKTCKWEPESAYFIRPACKPNAVLEYDHTIRAGFKFCPYCGHRIIYGQER